MRFEGAFSRSIVTRSVSEALLQLSQTSLTLRVMMPKEATALVLD